MKAQFQSHSGSATASKAVTHTEPMQEALNLIMTKPCTSYERAENNVLSFMTAHERAKMLAKRTVALLEYLGVPSYPKNATPLELASFVLKEDTRYVIEAAKQRKIKQIFGGSNAPQH